MLHCWIISSLKQKKDNLDIVCLRCVNSQVLTPFSLNRPVETSAHGHVEQLNQVKNKKVLLREGKRHTTRRVASMHSAAPVGDPPPHSDLGWWYPPKV